MTRLLFLGTPTAAIPTLELLAADFDIALVITQPDRPRGRSGRPVPPPVKTAAEELGLPVAQPGKGDDVAAVMADAGPIDVGIVVAYGRILDAPALSVPRHGLLNIHFSLLPRWRGAAPVARALIAGDTMTGVSVIKIDEGLDTGPVLTAQAVDIFPDETAGELTDRLAVTGARLLVSSLEAFVSGVMVPTPQVDEGATHAPSLTAADRRLTTDLHPEGFVNKVRGLAPVPAATMLVDDQPTKVLRAALGKTPVPAGTWHVIDERLFFGLDSGSVEILQLQSPGRRITAGADWARGRRADQGVIGSDVP